MAPWDVIGSLAERRLLPGDGPARAFYAAAAWTERRYPQAAVRLWQYPMITIRKPG